MKLRILGESDEDLRALKRYAQSSGDWQALEKYYHQANRAGIVEGEAYLSQVRAFCVTSSSTNEYVVNVFANRHAVRGVVMNQITGIRDRDLHMFDMENGSGQPEGVCFVDRKNKIPDGGTILNPRLSQYTRNNMTPEQIQEFMESWDLKMVPAKAWFLTIYHFSSVDNAREHYGKLYSGTQARIAYKKLDAGTIGLQDKNPPNFPKKSNGFPYKSNRAALKWASEYLPPTTVGSLQGPEVKVNRQFLFCAI